MVSILHVRLANYNFLCLSLLSGLSKPLAECLVDVESMDIFPVGWCEANVYPLTPLRKAVCEYEMKSLTL